MKARKSPATGLPDASTIFFALALADIVNLVQTRKYEKLPYIMHLTGWRSSCAIMGSIIPRPSQRLLKSSSAMSWPAYPIS